MHPNRRQFLALSAAAFSAASLGASGQNPGARLKRCVFTKAFQSLSYEALAERMATLGADGIEATVRKGGHIEPEKAPDELPKLVAALKTHGLEVTVMASNINDPSDPLSEKTLRLASKLGIQRYRMDYYHYAKDREIDAQHTEWRAKLKDLAAMNRALGLTGLYQNHAGEAYFGAGLWDLHEVLAGIDRREIGVMYDIRHATVEGGHSWPVAFLRVLPHIETIICKDFVWKGGKVENVPLGEGQVDYPRYLKMLAGTDFSGPVSLHVEYIDHLDPELVPQHLAANQRDLQRLDALLSTAFGTSNP